MTSDYSTVLSAYSVAQGEQDYAGRTALRRENSTVQGEQHYGTADLFADQKQFQQLQKRDNLKAWLCARHQYTPVHSRRDPGRRLSVCRNGSQDPTAGSSQTEPA